MIQKALSVAKEPLFSKYIQTLVPIIDRLKTVSFGSKLYHKLVSSYPEINNLLSQRNNNMRINNLNNNMTFISNNNISINNNSHNFNFNVIPNNFMSMKKTDASPQNNNFYN